MLPVRRMINIIEPFCQASFLIVPHSVLFRVGLLFLLLLFFDVFNHANEMPNTAKTVVDNPKNKRGFVHLFIFFGG